MSQGLKVYLTGGVKRYCGRDLTRTREVIGITAAEFAAILGMSRSSLYRMENEKGAQVPFPVSCALKHLRARYGALAEI